MRLNVPRKLPRAPAGESLHCTLPANRIGATELRLDQLKIVQEVVTLTVFVPFAIFYMRQPIRWDYLWAALCIVGAVYFVFRAPSGAAH